MHIHGCLSGNILPQLPQSFYHFQDKLFSSDTGFVKKIKGDRNVNITL